MAMLTNRNCGSPLFVTLFGLMVIFNITPSDAQVKRPYTPATERFCSNKLNGPGGVNSFCYEKQWHSKCWAEHDAVCTYRTKEERLKACCQMLDIKPECMEMCSFKPRFDFVCSSECWSDYKKLMSCAANGADNTACCKEDKVLKKPENVHCLGMCAGKTPKLAEATNSIEGLAKWRPCFYSFYTMMECHEENFPSDDNWEVKKKWEEEEVDENIVKFLEEFGKCEEKEKKRKAAEEKAKKKEAEQKAKEESEANAKFEAEKGKTGSDENKQARLEECCKAQNVKPECMELCSFSLTMNLLCENECFDDLKKVTYCAANGQDNTKCCTDNKIFEKSENCMQFCRGDAPALNEAFKSSLSMLAFKPCADGMSRMLQCHKREFPDEDEWKKRTDWKQESVPEAQKKTMEKYGKC